MKYYIPVVKPQWNCREGQKKNQSQLLH